MATTMVLATGSMTRPQRVSHTNITEARLHRKPIYYREYYIPTVTTSNQLNSHQLLTNYYLSSQREKQFYKTTGTFHDHDYYYSDDTRQTQRF